MDSNFGEGNGPVAYSNVECVGHETSLDACSKSSYGSFTCTNDNAAGVLCADGKSWRESGTK